MLLIDFSPLTFKWILQLDKDGPDLGQHLAGDDQAHVLVDDGLQGYYFLKIFRKFRNLGIQKLYRSNCIEF